MESQRSLVHLVCKYVALIQPLLPLLLLHPQSTSLVKSQLELTRQVLGGGIGGGVLCQILASR